MLVLTTVSLAFNLPLYPIETLGLIEVSIVTNEIWPLFLPSPSPTDLSPMAIEWFSMMRTSAALVHSSISFACSHIDASGPTKLLTNTPEAVGHNVEAIRQINLVLSQKNFSDDILLAILGMSRAREETDKERQKGIELNKNSPFKLPPMPPEWQRNFIHLGLEESHWTGARTFVGFIGGIQAIRSMCR